MEKLSEYTYTGTVLKAQALTKALETSGTGVSVDGYSKAMYITNIGGTVTSGVYFEATVSGVGDSGYSNITLASGTLASNGTHLIEVDFLTAGISDGVVSANVTSLDNSLVAGVSAVLFSPNGLTPDTQEKTVISNFQ